MQPQLQRSVKSVLHQVCSVRGCFVDVCRQPCLFSAVCCRSPLLERTVAFVAVCCFPVLLFRSVLSQCGAVWIVLSEQVQNAVIQFFRPRAIRTSGGVKIEVSSDPFCKLCR